MNLPPPAPALTLHKAVDLVASPLTWVVEQIIPVGMLTVLSGKDKMGKTLLAWEIARTVSRGTPFLSQFPVTSGPLIFLALDDPAVVTVDRLDQLGLTDKPVGDSDIYIATPLDGRHTESTFWPDLEKQIGLLKPRLVVVDALYLFLPLGNEAMNQAGAMGPLMQRLNQIVERSGTTVLLITHDTKAGADVAGSFVIRAAAKHILRLGLPPNSSPPPSRRVLTVESKVVERTDWTLEFSGPGEWRLVDTDAEKLAATKAAVGEWLKQGQRGTAQEISQALGKRRADVEAVLKQLVAQGSVHAETVRGGKGRPRQEYSWISGPDSVGSGAGPKVEGEALTVVVSTEGQGRGPFEEEMSGSQCGEPPRMVVFPTDDLWSLPDNHAEIEETLRQMTEASRDRLMPFGKYKGVPLRQLPANYVKQLRSWMEKEGFDGDLRDGIEAEWDARFGSGKGPSPNDER